MSQSCCGRDEATVLRNTVESSGPQTDRVRPQMAVPRPLIQERKIEIPTPPTDFIQLASRYRARLNYCRRCLTLDDHQLHGGPKHRRHFHHRLELRWDQYQYLYQQNRRVCRWWTSARRRGRIGRWFLLHSGD